MGFYYDASLVFGVRLEKEDLIDGDERTELGKAIIDSDDINDWGYWEELVEMYAKSKSVRGMCVCRIADYDSPCDACIVGIDLGTTETVKEGLGGMYSRAKKFDIKKLKERFEKSSIGQALEQHLPKWRDRLWFYFGMTGG